MSTKKVDNVKSSPSASAGETTSSMWGGRFDSRPSQVMERINTSIDFDKRLYRQDIAQSCAHCTMLAHQGIISEADAEAILGGLAAIEREIEVDDFVFTAELEDIHMNIESRLRQLIGDAAGRLHTARSRNDQVATDFRLWVRDALDGVDGQLQALQRALIDKAAQHAADVLPGFTHLQPAQPVTLGHHLLAYVEMFGRDRSRARDCRARLNQCPLGAAALAGTSFDIDRHMTAQQLGFDAPMANSLDAVSDRDFAVEFLALAALIAVHLSRLAEELVIWSGPQFAFASLPDAFSTGSSIMPQKRNPDAAELVRGKTGRVFGALQSLLVALKGLPLAYSKDMQEDKEPVFDAADTIELGLAAMVGMITGVTYNTQRMAEVAGVGFTTATDLADWLVREAGLPFRDAHHVTGALVKRAEQLGCDLDQLSLEEMQRIESRITQAAFDVLGVDNSVASRVSYGGTAPRLVKEAVAEARRRFLERGASPFFGDLR